MEILEIDFGYVKSDFSKKKNLGVWLFLIKIGFAFIFGFN